MNYAKKNVFFVYFVYQFWAFVDEIQARRTDWLGTKSTHPNRSVDSMYLRRARSHSVDCFSSGPVQAL